MTEYIRPNWDEYFIEILNTVAKRATCDRGRSGCVIVKDNMILTTGYVGSPRGLPHCDDVGHLYKMIYDDKGKGKRSCQATVHAETNAICQAARIGISLYGATLYCTMTPCRTCAMSIIQCGIIRVISINDYSAGQDSKDMFEQANIDFTCLNENKLLYKD